MPRHKKIKTYSMTELMKLPSTQAAMFKDEKDPEKIVEYIHKKIKDYSVHWEDQHKDMENALKFLSTDQWRKDIREARDEHRAPSISIPVLQGIRDNVLFSSTIPTLTVKINAKDLMTESTSGMNDDAEFISDDGNKTFNYAQFAEGFVNSVLHSSNTADHFNEVLGRAIDMGFGGYLMMYVDRVDEFSDDDELEIKFQHNPNPFSFLLDPTCREPDFRDMNFFCDFVELTKEEAIALYGDKPCFQKPAAAEKENDTLPSYVETSTEDMVRIIDVWMRKPIKKKVVRLSDGSYMFYDDYLKSQAELEVQGNPAVGKISERTFWQVKKYCMCKDELLGQAEVVPGFSSIPCYPLVGKSYEIKTPKGTFKKMYRGLVQLAGEAQHLYNLTMSNVMDKVGRKTNNLYQMPGASADDRERVQEEIVKSGPRVIRTPKGSPIVPVTPGTVDGEDIQLLGVLPEIIRNVTGVSQSALGQRSNEISARALKASKQQSDAGILVYPKNASIMVKRIAEDIISNARIIYGNSRRVVIEDDEGEPVPITIGAVTQINDKEGNEVGIYRNDIARNPKMEIVVEHTMEEPSRRDQMNNTLSEVSKSIPDAGIQTYLTAQMIKNAGGPGAGKIASTLLIALGNPDYLTKAEFATMVKHRQKKGEAIEELRQQGYDVSAFDGSQEETPPDVQIQQLKAQQEEMKLQLAQIEYEKELALAEIQLEQQQANTAGLTAAAQQKMSAAEKSRVDVEKSRIEAQKHLTEIDMKINKETNDIKTLIDERVAEQLSHYLGQAAPETQ